MGGAVSYERGNPVGLSTGRRRGVPAPETWRAAAPSSFRSLIQVVRVLVLGSWFRVESLGFWVHFSFFLFEGFGFWDLGFGFRVEGLRFKVQEVWLLILAFNFWFLVLGQGVCRFGFRALFVFVFCFLFFCFSFCFGCFWILVS